MLDTLDEHLCWRYLIAAAIVKARANGATYREIAEATGMGLSWVHRRSKRTYEDPAAEQTRMELERERWGRWLEHIASMIENGDDAAKFIREELLDPGDIELR